MARHPIINVTKTLNLIERHEGREKYPYMDTTGHITIGVGWNLSHNGLPEKMIDELRDRAYANAVNRALQYPWFKDLNEARKGVIVDMLYNLGKNGFDSFKRMQAALENHDYELAAREMYDSRWAQQVKTRADTLIAMMRSGKWPDGV